MSNPDLNPASGAPNTDDVLLQVTQLLGQLTARVTGPPVLEPVGFTVGSGRSLDDFFKEFEAYANGTFGPDKKLWTPRLAKYLEGPILQLYQSLFLINQEYDTIKSPLQNSFGTIGTASPADLLEQFNTCEFNPTEGIKGFISRLSALAEKAYDGAAQCTIDEIVKRRCVSALPSSLSTPLNFWLLSNLNAGLQELMRVGLGLEKTVGIPEAAAVAAPMTVPPVPARRKESFPLVSGQPPAISGSRSSESSATASAHTMCSYCQKPGHDISVCRLKKGRCFRCGQQGHFVAQCPSDLPASGTNSARFRSRRPVPSPRTLNYGPPASPALNPVPNPATGANAISPSCTFCGELGHVMARCPHFTDFIEGIVEKRLNR